MAHGVDVRRHGLTAAAAEHDDVEQRVGAEPVGAVHRHARALAGGVEAGEHRVGGVDHDLGVDVGGNPAHGVVGGGLDGNGVGLRLEALVGADEVGDVGDLGVDVLGREVGEVEVDVVLVGSRAAALPDLGEDRPAHHVARREVLDRGRVALHEPLAVAIEEDAALGAGRLRQQDPELVDAGGVELEELHVLERDAPPVEQPRSVARERVGIGGDLEHLAEAAGGEQHGLGGEHVEIAGGELVGHDTGHAAVDERDVEHLVLVEEVDVARHALLVQRLQDHVAGAVGRITRPLHRRLTVVARVAPEGALVDLALGRAVERHAKVLELDDRVDRLAAHDLGRRLVDEVVAALHGVEGVPLPGVLLDVGQRRAHAALGRARVGARRVELGEHRRAALARRLDRRP